MYGTDLKLFLSTPKKQKKFCRKGSKWNQRVLSICVRYSSVCLPICLVQAKFKQLNGLGKCSKLQSKKLFILQCRNAASPSVWNTLRHDLTDKKNYITSNWQKKTCAKLNSSHSQEWWMFGFACLLEIPLSWMYYYFSMFFYCLLLQLTFTKWS